MLSQLDPGSMLGDYEVVGVLGRGGIGTVYAGVHPIIGKKVAIKCLNERLAPDSASLQLFINEARAVNAIGHTGIVDIFNIGQLQDGRPYLVMEFLDGETLADRLRAAPLRFDEIFGIVDAVLSALEAAHEKGFVHRDLKPENVMLLGGSPPRVKLVDFGIAKLTRADGTLLASSGNAVGTPSFMAPEQRLCEPVDARTDLYSLGVMMFLLFTGRLPLTDEDSPRPGELAQMPAALERAILDCLEKSRERRPSSARELRRRLSEIARRPRRRARALLVGAAGVVVLVAAVGLQAPQPRPRPPQSPPPSPSLAVAVQAPVAAPAPPVPVAAETVAAPVHHKVSRHVTARRRPGLDDIGDFPVR
jgi:serine/threonine-protein kinase